MKSSLYNASPIFVALLIATFLQLPLYDPHRSWFFDRNNATMECEIEDTQNDPPTTSLISQEQMDSFSQDGIIILRNVISKDWLRSYRKLLMHVFQNPTKWDVMYSRLVANFYGAQKSIFLHQSSRCGAYIGSKSPTSRIAAQLFSRLHSNGTHIDEKIRMRVIEPTEALINYEDGDGHTSWHRDDPYMNYDQVEGERSATVIRLWVPLMDMSPGQMKFMALNNSKVSKFERKLNNLNILGSKFSNHDNLTSSELFNRHIVDPGSNGYQAGDVLVFAGDTPHFAQGLNCSTVGCARLIFSFAIDGVTNYKSGKLTSLIPLYSGQEDGKPLRGSQFPLIYPEPDTQELGSLHPTYGDVIKSMLHAMAAGLSSFQGYDIKKSIPYFSRVYDAAKKNVWVKPHLDLVTGQRIQ